MSASLAYMFFLLWKYEGSPHDFAIIQVTGESCNAMYLCRKHVRGQTDEIEI